MASVVPGYWNNPFCERGGNEHGATNYICNVKQFEMPLFSQSRGI